MVISHSCDFTKLTKNRPDLPILVAPVFQIDQVEDDLRGNAREDRVARYMRLPDEPPTEDVCVVNLALIQPVWGGRLLEAERLASIPEDARLAMADRVTAMLFQTERKPKADP
jgi:hypothetical protein